MSEIKSMEHATLKVPYEVLNKKFRVAQKTLDREVDQVQNATKEVEKAMTNNGSTPTIAEISKLVGGVVERLQVLKRKAVESISDELTSSYVCKRKLEHLKGNVAPELKSTYEIWQASVDQWKRIRMDRMVIEHLLRMGYYETAESLADRTDIKHLTNLDIFQTSREVEEDLASHRTSKCVVWCNDNKSKLRKINSNIEFQLRVQEFVEFIRANCRTEAVKHARKYFPSFENTQLNEICKCMALLAYQPNTDFFLAVKLFVSPSKRLYRRAKTALDILGDLPLFILAQQQHMQQKNVNKRFSPFVFDFLFEKFCGRARFWAIEPYKSLFDLRRWTTLVLNFRNENYRLFQLSSQSLLSVAVQAGLSSLKTPQCYSPNCKNLNCPVCQEDFNHIAKQLPYSHCVQSRLICRITGIPLNEHNLPMMLPNGQIFGQLAIPQITKENGTVVCPITKTKFSNPKIEKVFVM